MIDIASRVKRSSEASVMKAIFGVLLAIAMIEGATAYAWNIQEDHGSWALIRCADGSNATVSNSNGSWTVTSAGNNGRAGGKFAIIGQAAQYGCGE